MIHPTNLVTSEVQSVRQRERPSRVEVLTTGGFGSAKEKADDMLTIIKAKANALAKAKQGVTAIEYGLIAGFVALVILGGIQLFGTRLNAFFTSLAGQLPAGG